MKKASWIAVQQQLCATIWTRAHTTKNKYASLDSPVYQYVHTWHYKPHPILLNFFFFIHLLTFLFNSFLPPRCFLLRLLRCCSPPFITHLFSYCKQRCREKKFNRTTRAYFLFHWLAARLVLIIILFACSSRHSHTAYVRESHVNDFSYSYIIMCCFLFTLHSKCISSTRTILITTHSLSWLLPFFLFYFQYGNNNSIKCR